MSYPPEIMSRKAYTSTWLSFRLLLLLSLHSARKMMITESPSFTLLPWYLISSEEDLRNQERLVSRDGGVPLECESIFVSMHTMAAAILRSAASAILPY